MIRFDIQLFGGRGSSSSTRSGGSLNGYEATTNETIMRDVIREIASKPNGITYRQSEKIGKILDKNTEDGDKLVLLKIVKDPSTKAGARISDDVTYQMERINKGKWKVMDGKGKSVIEETETDGALRAMVGMDYSMQRRGTINTMRVYHKKKR